MKTKYFQNMSWSQNMLRIFNGALPCEALISDPEDYKRLHSMNTNAYVWGEGYQVDPTQDYSNFTPKKIQHFKGKEQPNVVDMAFGWYHEAFVDAKGQLWVCVKARLTSIEVIGIRDGGRPDMQQITNLPRGTKVKQVSFTQNRMFVLSHTGKLYVYKIVEHFPTRDDVMFGAKAGPRGELIMDKVPTLIKDIPFIS